MLRLLCGVPASVSLDNPKSNYNNHWIYCHCKNAATYLFQYRFPKHAVILSKNPRDQKDAQIVSSESHHWCTLRISSRKVCWFLTKVDCDDFMTVCIQRNFQILPNGLPAKGDFLWKSLLWNRHRRSSPSLVQMNQRSLHSGVPLILVTPFYMR